MDEHLTAAITAHLDSKDTMAPALAIKIRCCSMVSKRPYWFDFAILTNSSIQHTPWSANTRAPATNHLLLYSVSRLVPSWTMCCHSHRLILLLPVAMLIGDTIFLFKMYRNQEIESWVFLSNAHSYTCTKCNKNQEMSHILQTYSTHTRITHNQTMGIRLYRQTTLQLGVPPTNNPSTIPALTQSWPIILGRNDRTSKPNGNVIWNEFDPQKWLAWATFVICLSWSFVNTNPRPLNDEDASWYPLWRETLVFLFLLIFCIFFTFLIFLIFLIITVVVAWLPPFFLPAPAINFHEMTNMIFSTVVDSMNEEWGKISSIFKWIFIQ